MKAYPLVPRRFLLCWCSQTSLAGVVAARGRYAMKLLRKQAYKCFCPISFMRMAQTKQSRSLAAVQRGSLPSGFSTTVGPANTVLGGPF